MKSKSRLIELLEMRNKKGGKSIVAFFIIFGLVLAPIQIPLEKVLITTLNQDGSLQNTESVSQVIEEQNEHTTQLNESVYTVTYSKGETTPVLTSTPQIDAPAVVHPENALLVSTEIPAETIAKAKINTRSNNRTQVHPNILGAEQVARGENGSELTSVVLDSKVNIVALIDAHGAKTAATYNDAQSPTQIEYPDGGSVSYSYNAHGQITGITYNDRAQTSNPEKGLIETVARAIVKPFLALAGIGEETATTEIKYDGDAVTEIGDAQSSISYEYDDEGLLIQETRTDGSYIEYSYDELGNIVEKTEFAANPTTEFSFASFLKQTIAGILPVSYSESVEYDDMNQLVRYKIDRITQPEENLGTTTETTVTAETTTGTTTTTDELAPTESVTIESVPMGTDVIPALPQETNEALPQEIIEDISPEATTDVISWFDGLSTRIYGTITQVFSLSYADETNEDSLPVEEAVAVQETNDESQAPTTDPVVIDQASFAPITEEVITNETATPSIIQGLELEEQPVRTASDATTTHEVDTLSAPSETVETPAYLDLTFTYDAQGNLVRRLTQNGFGVTYSYDTQTDARNGITVQNQSDTILEYTYDIDSTTARIVGNNGARFQYDKTGALTRAGTTRYSYDERGNRLSAVGDDTDTAYKYNANRLETISYSNGRITSYKFNERGQVTTIQDTLKGATELAYNETGAIASIENTTERLTYTYDAVGRRASRTSSHTGTLNYTYTGPQLTKVQNENGDIIREYFYTPKGDLVAVVSSSTLYHVITDTSKSVVGLVNDQNGELLSQTYDVWGSVITSTIGDLLDIGYVGTFMEPSFGFSILGPRVYDPEIGRFLSKDPLPGFLIDTLSQNEYLYAKNDPVNHFDPSGHQSELADTSTSPVRALVETKLLIESLESERTSTKAVVQELESVVQDLPDDQEAIAQLEGARQSLIAIESALGVLASMKKNQEDEIAANETRAAQGATFSVPTVDVGSVNLAIPTLEPFPNTSPEVTPLPDDTSENDEEEDSVSYLGAPTLALKAFSDNFILKAEAKKKKSKKDKKSKKKKKKASSKAKEAQKKKAEQAAKMNALLKKLSLLLSDLKVNVDKRILEEKKIAQRRAEELKRQKEEEERKKEEEKKRLQSDIERLQKQLVIEKEIERLQWLLEVEKAEEVRKLAEAETKRLADLAIANNLQNANAHAEKTMDSIAAAPSVTAVQAQPNDGSAATIPEAHIIQKKGFIDTIVDYFKEKKDDLRDFVIFAKNNPGKAATYAGVTVVAIGGVVFCAAGGAATAGAVAAGCVAVLTLVKVGGAYFAFEIVSGVVKVTSDHDILWNELTEKEYADAAEDLADNTLLLVSGAGLIKLAKETSRIPELVKALQLGNAEVRAVAKTELKALMGKARLTELKETSVQLKLFYAPKISISDVKVQSVYSQHSEPWGFKGINWNPENGELLKAKLLAHINDTETIAIKGTYRKTTDVIHYYNPKNNLWVSIDTATNDIISGWKLDTRTPLNGISQVDDLLTNLNVQ